VVSKSHLDLKRLTMPLKTFPPVPFPKYLFPKKKDRKEE